MPGNRTGFVKQLVEIWNRLTWPQRLSIVAITLLGLAMTVSIIYFMNRVEYETLYPRSEYRRRSGDCRKTQGTEERFHRFRKFDSRRCSQKPRSTSCGWKSRAPGWAAAEE